MKTEFIHLLALTLGTTTSLLAHDVVVTNSSDAAITVNVGSRGDWYGLQKPENEKSIPAGQKGTISTSWCPWFIKISDANNLSQAPLSYELHFDTPDHCWSKYIDVNRLDNYMAPNGTIVNTSTGTGSVNTTYPITSRVYRVKSDRAFYKDNAHTQKVEANTWAQ